MSRLLTVAYLFLSVAAGVAILGLVERLTLTENLVGGVTVGTIFSATLTLLCSIPFGLNGWTVFAGPVALLVLTYVAAQLLHRDILAPYYKIRGVPDWRSPRVLRWVVAAAITTTIFAFILAHAVVDTNGGLYAGYPTVWADWSQHLSTQSAFVVGGNLPPHNSLYAGTPLLYPFLSDFHAAELNTLGIGPGASLAVASAVMLSAVALLMICVALRLKAKFLAGILAASIIFIGGGWGFTGALADSCAMQQTAAGAIAATTFTNSYDANAGCSIHDVITKPAALVASVGGMGYLVSHQPRAYDGLASDQPYCASCAPGDLMPVANTQWYTPLMAWWLPQRPMAYGTAGLLLALVLILAVQGSAKREWVAVAIAGLILGLLPLVHVHAFLTFVMVSPLLLLWRRRKEWWLLIGVAAAVALPRMAMVASGPHGSTAWGNPFPTIQPGWLSTTDAPQAFTLSNLVGAAPRTLSLLVSGNWWEFWLTNLGIAVPLVLLAAVALALSLWRENHQLRRWTDSALILFGGDAAIFAVIMSVVFVAANVVVFQSWNWDNTKLFAYWYIGPALLIGALVVNAWGRWWRNIFVSVCYGTVILTGLLVTARLLPWTPVEFSMTNVSNLHIATPQERNLAQQIVAKTAPTAIFVTTRANDDPVETLAGRTTLLGFWAWMWSYGVDFGTAPNDRIDDVTTILRGCARVPAEQCKVWGLLKRYGVSYVEIDSTGANTQEDRGNSADPSWWAQQSLPVVAATSDRVVYDVRHHG